ncbi:hypothetical protein LOTGIDRAFT_166623 [Lottia gigantea]|uniref:Cadherin domain-containing protein n=1 Tax=Lottia gigantea TaxID=225164 RepID=V4BF29_LOTGI|nr:hypothetical protein LOTGIDRAFT_166623 [Lottia gigantea]ESO87469.1 hypothetical protein LOTGIDRAFT_166623 [Lottia gigantea]
MLWSGSKRCRWICIGCDDGFVVGKVVRVADGDIVRLVVRDADGLVVGDVVGLILAQPVINNQPITGSLPEATFLQTAIVDINCTDAVDPVNGRVAVNLVDVTSSPSPGHCSACFQVFNLNTAVPNEWKLYFVPGDLDYFTASRYDIRVQCKDSADMLSPLVIIGINVIPNAPPYFSPIYQTINITNSGNRTAGFSIYTATAVDTNSDSLFYTMTTSVTSDIFQINSATGEITLIKPLGGLCRNNLLIYIEAVDNVNPERARLTLNINFLQMNLPAVITNMNRVVSIQENRNVKRIPVNRFDIYQPNFSCTLTVQVSTMQTKITYNPIEGAIDISTLNYEVDSNTNITVQCTDGLCLSTTKWLYIQILDVNDVPSLNPPSQSLTASEGFINTVPNLIVKDEDVNDPHKFEIVSITPVTAGFEIYPDTGRLITTVDFRVDKNNQIVLDFLIAAEDTKGKESTNNVSIRLTVYDINDHRPKLDKSSFEFTLEECHPLGVLAQLTATDEDGGNNAQITYENIIKGPITVSSNGTISLTSPPVAGSFTTLESYAVDKGLNPGVLKSPTPAVITVIGIPCPTVSTIPPVTDVPTPSIVPPTTPVPQPTLPPNERKNNVKDMLWIAGSCVLGLLIAAILIFILYRCHKAARSRQRNISKSMTDLTPRKREKPIKLDKVRRRSSVMAENPPDAPKQTQNDYFNNDVKDTYRENYKKKDLPSAVETT